MQPADSTAFQLHNELPLPQRASASMPLQATGAVVPMQGLNREPQAVQQTPSTRVQQSGTKRWHAMVKRYGKLQRRSRQIAVHSSWCTIQRQWHAAAAADVQRRQAVEMRQRRQQQYQDKLQRARAKRRGVMINRWKQL